MMPMCACQPPRPMVLRRVMGLVDNGRYFAQCASKLCKRRIWLIPAGSTNPILQGDPPAELPDGALPGKDLRWSRRGGQPSKERWSRHSAVPAEAAARAAPTGLFVQRTATGEFAHGRRGVARVGGHLLSVPDARGVVRTLAEPEAHEQRDIGICSSGTCTPVTSGAEELLEDEEETRLPPPDLNLLFEKRWQRAAPSRSRRPSEACVSEELSAHKMAVLDAFPAASPSLIEELFFQGFSIDECMQCMCS